MGRADWGGGGDLSGLFASLQNEYQNRVEAATKRARADAEREQGITDQETYDQWKNGIITDEQWLAYIRDRVESTKSDVDKTDHENWVKMLREHETSIADSQTEQAFSDGSISIHRIIGYYKQRMENVEKNSPEYRDLSKRYYDLLDTRDSDDIYDGAQEIIDRIQRGRGSYSELLRFYQNKLKGVRKNSDLYRQISREINSVRDIVDGVTGGAGGSGSGSGRKGKGISAQDAAQINALIASRAKNGSLLFPEGEDPIQSATALVDDGKRASYLDALKSDATRIQNMAEQEQNNPAADTVTDLVTGQQYKITPEFMNQLDKMYLRTEDMIWAINWQNGDYSAAASALNYASSYINNHMQRHNTQNMKPAWDSLMNHGFAAIQGAAADPDPNTRINTYRQFAEAVQKFQQNALNIVTKKSRQLVADEDLAGGSQGGADNVATQKKTMDLLPDKNMQEDMTFASQLAEILGDPDMDLLSRQDAFSQLVDQRPEGFYLSEADLERLIIGKSTGDADKQAPGILDTYAARDGLAEGTWGYMAMGSTVQPVPMELIQQNRQALSQKGQQMVTVFENVGGSNVPVARPTDSEKSYQVYVDQEGQLVKSSVLKSMSPENLANLLNSGTYKIQTIASWQALTMSDGHTWYQDPATKLWYKDRPPFRIKTDATGTVMVDDQGHPQYDVLQMASESGVIAPFAGMDNRSAQDLANFAVDNGLIDLSQVWSRDENGNSLFEHPVIDGSYWSPADDAIAANNQDFLNDITRKKSISQDSQPQSLDWDVRQEARRRAAVQDFMDRNYTRQQQVRLRKLEPELNPLDFTAKQLADFGRAIGVSVSGNEIEDLKVQQNEIRRRAAGTAQTPPAGAIPPVGMAPLAVERTRGAEINLPTLPVPEAKSGRTVAPELPKPPRPNLVEGADAPKKFKPAAKPAPVADEYQPKTATGRRGGFII